jgi:hypothetical protein
MKSVESLVRGARGRRRGLAWGDFSRGLGVVWIGSRHNSVCASVSAVRQLILRQDFEVSAERVYDALADQDGMSAWMGGKISVPVRGEGGLVGTVRRIHIGSASFDERIVEAQRPSLIAYIICSPVPLLVKHRGELRVESLSARRSRVTWQIDLVLRSALVAAVVRPMLTFALGGALKRLASKLH